MRNFFLTTCLLACLITACSPKQPATVQSQSTSTIGYTSVESALTALQARKDVTIAVKGGWTIVTEQDGLTTWSFAPTSDPAYPAVAKRVLYQEQGAWYIKMDVLCEAGKASCDQFEKNFETLNDQMIQAIRQGQQP